MVLGWGAVFDSATRTDALWGLGFDSAAENSCLFRGVVKLLAVVRRAVFDMTVVGTRVVEMTVVAKTPFSEKLLVATINSDTADGLMFPVWMFVVAALFSGISVVSSCLISVFEVFNF